MQGLPSHVLGHWPHDSVQHLISRHREGIFMFNDQLPIPCREVITNNLRLGKADHLPYHVFQDLIEDGLTNRKENPIFH